MIPINKFSFRQLDKMSLEEAKESFRRYLNKVNGVNPTSYLEVTSYVSYLYFESENIESLNSYLVDNIKKLADIKKIDGSYKYTNKDLSRIFHAFVKDNLDNKPKIRNHMNFIKQSVWETYDSREPGYKPYPHVYPKKNDITFYQDNKSWIKKNFVVFMNIDSEEVITLPKNKASDIPKVIGGNVRCFKDERGSVWKEITYEESQDKDSFQKIYINSGVVNDLRAKLVRQEVIDNKSKYSLDL